jgi:hypothetical protein
MMKRPLGEPEPSVGLLKYSDGAGMASRDQARLRCQQCGNGLDHSEYDYNLND